METLKGILEEIVFHNEENGYTVAGFAVNDDLITAVGSLPGAERGGCYLLHGEFTEHPVYGEQFAFSAFEIAMPEGEQEIEAFLASGLIKGVGPKTAALIVGRFGTDTLRVIEEEPDRLTIIKGIGPKSADKISASFTAHKAFAEISIYLSRFGISPQQAIRLYREYGDKTVETIEQNPYKLIGEVHGIGFKKADEIALKMGFAPDGEPRIISGIVYVLSEYASQGHTCYPVDELKETAAQLLDLPIDLVYEMICRESIKLDGLFVMDSLTTDGIMIGDGRVKGEDVVYLKMYWLAEKDVAYLLRSLVEAERKPLTGNIDSCIAFSEQETGRQLSETQKNAVRNSVGSGVSVITGGPGTGKTTIVSALLSIFDESGLEVLLAAPTGRAAKRITEQTGRSASTIHRMLEYQRDDASGRMLFGRTEENQLDCDVIILDEASMIDLMLMHALVKAVPQGARLILVGDCDQLPPVGAGNVLNDLIESGFVNVSRLTEIYRQAEESRIVSNAHRINRGESLVMNGKDSDFFFLTAYNERDIQKTIVDLVTKRLPAYYKDIDPLNDIQVITPVHKGDAGTIELNRVLQEAINPPAPEKVEKKAYGLIFREGDKVMQIRNDYNLASRKAGTEDQYGVFNGDVGTIYSIDEEEGLVNVLYDDRLVEYDNVSLDELRPAYAITVHKSQGSEFPIVVMPIAAFPPMLASRNLLYTAVTRGKSVVVLVGIPMRLTGMIENDRPSMRWSGLRQRLSDLVRFFE